jgi:hypothetical protein
MLVPKRSHAIPEKTVQVAQVTFPKGNRLMTLRDGLGPIFEDEAFAEPYPSLGQPAESPGRLALVTVPQFMEQLTVTVRQLMPSEAGSIGSMPWA